MKLILKPIIEALIPILYEMLKKWIEDELKPEIAKILKENGSKNV